MRRVVLLVTISNSLPIRFYLCWGSVALLITVTNSLPIRFYCVGGSLSYRNNLSLSVFTCVGGQSCTVRVPSILILCFATQCTSCNTCVSEVFRNLQSPSFHGLSCSLSFPLCLLPISLTPSLLLCHNCQVVSFFSFPHFPGFERCR